MAASAQPPPVGGPVILDFYADWCEPCKTLTPKLEKLINAAQGSVRLAKVNVDKLPDLAQALRVQSLPSVMLVHKGKLVDQFQGAPPDAQIEAFVKKAVDLVGGPATAARTLSEAAGMLEAGDLAAATTAYAALAELPEFAAAGKAGLVLCSLKDENLALAKELLESLKKEHPSELDKPEVRRAVSSIALAEAASANGTTQRSVPELQQLLEAAPRDHEARYELAQIHFAAGEVDEAVKELLLVVRRGRDWNDGAARTLLLQIFDSLGAEHELTKSGRRRLANYLLM